MRYFSDREYCAQPITCHAKTPPTWNAWWLFPPYVVYRALQSVLNRIFGHWIGRFIVKAANPACAQKHARAGLQKHAGSVSDAALFDFLSKTTQEKMQEPEGCGKHMEAHRFMIKVPKSTTLLDTLLLQDLEQGVQKDTKAILVVSGNTVLYEHDYALKRMLSDLQPNTMVLAFNYPGVGSSTGQPSSSKVLEDAVFAQIDFLLSQGVAPENIKIRAHSLGGGVASCVVAKAHQLGLPLHLFNDRSYARLSGAVQGYVEHYFVQRDWPRLGACLGWLLLPIIKGLLHLLNWEINAVDAYLSIDARHTELSVLRSSRHEREQHQPFLGDDQNILHHVSLYHALKHRVQRSMKHSRQQLKRIIDRLCSPDSLVLEEEKEQLRAFRRQLKQPKIIYPGFNRDAHGSCWSKLNNRFNHQPVVHSNYSQFRSRATHDHWLVKGESWVMALCHKYYGTKR